MTTAGEPFATGVSAYFDWRGDPLDVHATVFVSPDWRGPNLIGYVGVLDRLRFAIDPGGNRFYFGPLD